MPYTAQNNKVLVLGIDGMDPRLTRQYVDAGLLPNIQKYIETGACRQDLMLLGAHPTVTPPMWTTLATGAYPMTHGITEFFAQSTEKPDVMVYNLDSTKCEAEQVWNCFAEAGRKTLVWHWPGAAWPPSSDSPNLYVVDGTSPGTVNMARGQVDTEFVVGASEAIQEVTFIRDVKDGVAEPCVLTDLEADTSAGMDLSETYSSSEMRTIITDFSESQVNLALSTPMNVCQSPLKPAVNWTAAPAGAKEFTILLSKGLINRPCLALPNEAGIYDRVAIYKSKKDIEPLATLVKGVFTRDVLDEAIKKDVRYPKCNRDMKLMDIKPDGSQLKLYISAAMNAEFDGVWSPKSLYQTITSQIGFPPPSFMLDGTDAEMVEIMLEGWYHIADWQSQCLNYLIQNEGFEAVFSHYHNIDLQQHKLVDFLSDRGFNKQPRAFYEKAMENLYIQTDYYLGQFLPLLDQGWSIIFCSDHGLVGSKYLPPAIGDMSGLNVGLMEELGYTVMQRDAQGQKTAEVDWSKTRAFAMQATSIYLNLKGRWETGIVDAADQYELEEQIMTDLYGYKDPQTGKRVIALALRNKDAILLGIGGPKAGDIIFWTAEGYNYAHADALSTAFGEAGTSCSPIFIAAGAGVKKGYYTTRYIREVDVAPTAAVLGGVRMPRECEGAPAYQIFAETC